MGRNPGTDPGSRVGSYLMGQWEQKKEGWTEIGTDRERKWKGGAKPERKEERERKRGGMERNGDREREAEVEGKTEKESKMGVGLDRYAQKLWNHKKCDGKNVISKTDDTL